MSPSEFALGILVNLASGVLVFVIVWGALFVSRRRRLVDFFHVRDRGITLYTSTLYVKAGGSTDSRGTPRTFAGPAIPEAEARALADIERTLTAYAYDTLPILKHLRLVDIDCSVTTSPADTASVDRGRTLLTLGSPGYNTASEYVQAEFNPMGHFDLNNGAMLFRNGLTTTVMSGMVLRARHPTTGQVAFYAAGPSEGATVAAARYLLDHWITLARQYPGDQPFCVVVEASPQGGSVLLSQEPTPATSRWQRLMTRYR